MRLRKQDAAFQCGDDQCGHRLRIDLAADAALRYAIRDDARDQLFPLGHHGHDPLTQRRVTVVAIDDRVHNRAATWHGRVHGERVEGGDEREQLLDGIGFSCDCLDQSAGALLLGIEVLDQRTIAELLQLTGAVRLLGAEPVIVGVRPDVTIALAKQAIYLTAQRIYPNLQEAVQILRTRHTV
jgi:hypothetical protein